MPEAAIVAGIHYDSVEEARRRDVIRRFCKVGQRVFLRRELDNPDDPNAIAVRVKVRRLFWLEYQRIGYIDAGTAIPLCERLERGEKVRATIKSVSEPEGDKAPRITIQFE